MSRGTDGPPRPGRPGLAAIVALWPLMVAGCGREGAGGMPTTVPARGVVTAVRGPSGRPADRGRAIYTGGESPSGRPITARIGEGPAVAAAALACVRCHGGDGRGRPEGGVTPSDITWANLTRPYGVVHPDGRRHPAYSAALFGRAVTMGWDPAGQALSPAMPRYQMSAEDLADLIAYVREIAADAPGISESAIRIGVALPASGPPGPLGADLVKGLLAYADGINSTGGIFRRRLEFVVPASDGTDDRALFAAIGGVTPDGDPASDRLEAAGVPLVRVYPPPAAGWSAGRPGSFALLSGYAGQVRALVEFAARRRIGSDSGIAVIHAPSPGSRALAREASDRLREAGMNGVTVEVASSPALAGRIESRPPAVLLAAGPGMGDLGGWLATGPGGRTGVPSILVPEAIGGRWLADPPPALAGRLIVACPVPSWIGDAGPAAFRAARILVEALKSAGRELDRDAFIKAMEALVSDGDGGSPPIAFGPGRRVGLRGSAILRLGSGARSYESISPRIDPGPTADDWPDPASRRDLDVSRPGTEPTSSGRPSGDGAPGRSPGS